MTAHADDVLQHFGIDMPTELKHYGKKGMKWGVIRERGTDGRVTSKVVSEDHAKSRELKAKPRSQMSNAELETLNKRLQLEKTNNELQSRTALQKIKTGTSIAATILAVGGTANAAVSFVKSPAGQAVIKTVRDILK
jgi:hypothetical protein